MNNPITGITLVTKLDGMDHAIHASLFSHLRDIALKYNLYILDNPIAKNGFTIRGLPPSQLVVVVGGDGTMLEAMKYAAFIEGSVVVGFNIGHLGFLTSFDGVDNFNERLSYVIDTVNDPEFIDKRYLVAEKDNYVAVNEYLITTPGRQHPLVYNIYVNDQHVAEQRGDGVLISTATGSTAYALSAGGSIMVPSSDAKQIVPLAPHTLTSRPVIVGATDTVRVETIPSARQKQVELYADSRLKVIEDGPATFEFTTSRTVNVWRPADWNFFEVLRSKMGWNSVG